MGWPFTTYLLSLILCSCRISYQLLCLSVNTALFPPTCQLGFTPTRVNMISGIKSFVNLLWSNWLDPRELICRTDVKWRTVQFPKNIHCQSSAIFFENENFNTRALDLTFFLLPKIYLISSYIPVFEICKKYYIQYITPPYCTVEK